MSVFLSAEMAKTGDEAMNHHEHAHHDRGRAARHSAETAVPREKDPVCGMDVPADSPLRSDFGGRTYVFCSRSCLGRFQQDPGAFLGKAEPPAEAAPPADGQAPEK